MNIITKSFIFLISLVLAHSVSAAKVSIGKNELLLLSSGVGDDLFHYIVSKDRLNSIPSWNGQGEPRLSDTEATELALKKHKELNGATNSEVKKVSLRSKNTNCSVEQECPEVLWYYKIKVKGEKRASYIVLMNGEFVEPQK